MKDSSPSLNTVPSDPRPRVRTCTVWPGWGYTGDCHVPPPGAGPPVCVQDVAAGGVDSREQAGSQRGRPQRRLFSGRPMGHRRDHRDCGYRPGGAQSQACAQDMPPRHTWRPSPRAGRSPGVIIDGAEDVSGVWRVLLPSAVHDPQVVFGRHQIFSSMNAGA